MQIDSHKTCTHTYFTDLVKKSCKSFFRNVLVFNKSMANPVENVSWLPSWGVKCEQAAGPTGGPAQTPVVWILRGRVWGLPTSQVPVEKPHPCCTVACDYSCARTISKAPPFCVWVSDVMPRLCPFCAHRKLSAVFGIGGADFSIPYQGLRCSSNLSASIFIPKSCGSSSLSHTLPPQCQPFPWRQGGHSWWVASYWLQLVHSQAGIPH